MADQVVVSPVWSGVEQQRWRRLTATWMLVMLLLFPVLLLLGAFMRIVQANWLPTLLPEWFYAVMTLHGLGMVGTWFVGAMAAVSYVLTQYVRPSRAISWGTLAATVLGVLLLLVTTLVGRFGVGWYFLYPLPFYPAGVWPNWATWMFLFSLAILGVGWTVWAVDLLRAIARSYSLRVALAWHYIRGRTEPEVPPAVLITTVSLISALAGFLAAVIILVLSVLEWAGTGFTNDALLMKNLIFFFGHVLVNITMYLGVVLVYDVLPRYSARPWKTNRMVAIAWNTVLFLVLFAYFHHLYMDFVQPQWVQVLGQVASYFISVPAAVVTIFSALVLVYGASMRWTLSSILMYLGVMGWAIGGVAAVIDSTIAVNLRFHNTLWVPAHFHTYYLMGVVLMLLGFAAHFGQEVSQQSENGRLTKIITALFVIGGYGFLLMFYLGGAHSVPRRYAVYPQEVLQGVDYARIALGFIALLFLGVVLYLWETGRRCLLAFRTSP
jgi:cytochrome c oxidase subunit 1